MDPVTLVQVFWGWESRRQRKILNNISDAKLYTSKYYQSIETKANMFFRDLTCMHEHFTLKVIQINYWTKLGKSCFCH